MICELVGPEFCNVLTIRCTITRRAGRHTPVRHDVSIAADQLQTRRRHTERPLRSPNELILLTALGLYDVN
jgi:hypothetical protein